MPTSKLTRVRVLALLKISAHVWPLSGCFRFGLPRPFLNSRASLKMSAISRPLSCSTVSKCFMIRRSAALSQMPSADAALSILPLFDLLQPAVESRGNLFGRLLHQRPAHCDCDIFIADVLQEDAVWLHVLVPHH